MSKNNKKILVVTPLYPPEIGGPASYVKLLEEELPERGFGVDVIKFGDVKHLPYTIRHIVLFFKILARGRRVDIIYALDPLGVGIPAMMAAFVLGKKRFLRIAGDRAWETCMQSTQEARDKKSSFAEATEDRQDTNLEIFSKKKFHSLPVFFLKYGQWFAASLAQKIVVPSQYMKGIIKNWGVKEKKISVINTVFSSEIAEESKESLRKLFKLEGEILISVGRLVPWKGFKTLVEIMPEIIKREPEVKLLIVGSGPLERELELLVASCQLQGRVKLMGKLSREELMKYLKAADLFVLNTGYEGLSHQLLETMASGTPIVTTDVGGNPEVIENGREGILVEHDNKTELTEAILELLNNEKQRQLFIQNAREKVKNFSRERMVEKLDKLFT